ncbi:MAG TPA: shikimate kinase [Phaeodactylibacter sp.]|nr:shikimate kinase [Phaeodactylibacter sp.]
MQIFLIGFMGSGKSHTGRRLANLLQRPFTDLDQVIVKRAGVDIPTIFAEQGERYFRQLERDCLHTLTAPPKRVVACGGGTPCFFDNMAWMNQQGLTVYLRADAELLAQRLLKGRATRPLLKGLSPEQLPAFITEKLAARTPYYMRANVIYDQKEIQEDVAQALYHQFSNIIGH